MTKQVTLYDNEITVIIDSLLFTKENIEQNYKESTPNIDSALNKIESLVLPDTYELILSKIK